MREQVIVESTAWPVEIETDEDGVFIITCPSLPGCISDGHTMAESLVSISDAIGGYLESLRKHRDPIPAPTRNADN